MSRPIRLEFPDALYHLTSRGDRREDIYDDDADREAFLKIFSKVIEQNNWYCYSYCLMSNHYHLLVQTPDANLSKGMRQLNGIYTQYYTVFVKIVDRFGYAISCCLASLLSAGLSGFNITTSGLDQSRVCPLQRSGLSAFACA